MDPAQPPHPFHRAQLVFWSHPANTFPTLWTPAFWLGSSLSLLPPYLHSLPPRRERHGTYHAGIHPMAGRTQGTRYPF